MMLYAAGSVHDVSVDAEALCGLTWLGNTLYFADLGREQVVPVSPETGVSGDPVPCPGLRVGLATVDGNLVYAAGDDWRLRMVDPATGVVVREVRNPRPGEAVTAMEAGRNGLWLGHRDVLELRATADFSRIISIGVPGRVDGLTVTDRYLAYSDRFRESVTIVDPVSEQAILPINIHGRPTGLTWDGMRLWYCDTAHARLRAIDVPGMVPAA